MARFVQLSPYEKRYRSRTAEPNMDAAQLRSFLGSKMGLAVTLPFAILGAYLLWTHTGHVVYALPYLFLIACPLLHVFGHGHGHQHKMKDTK